MDLSEVTTPFRVILPAGSSTFVVRVPKHHLSNDRKFFFNHLHVAPDYFSKEADNLDLDADPEMNKDVDSPVQVRLEINEPTKLYGPLYQNSSYAAETLDVIDRINDHFESNRPEFIIRSPFFIDWTDLQLDKTNESNTYVPLVAQTYYGDIYRAVLHSNRLPESVRDLDGVNNHLPPFENMTDVAFNMRIRLRIWMAPYTKAIFSSNEPFVSDMGFTTDQFGKPIKKQYHLNNRSENWKMVAVGTSAPKKLITKVDFRITASSYDDYYVSTMQIARMMKRNWLKNDKVAAYLGQLFDFFSRQCNVRFSFGYKEDDRQFYFSLPQSDNLSVVVSCLPEFAMRLGFGPINFIRVGMQALPQKEPDDHIIQAQRKALALVYDTGPIVCTLDQVSSNTTSGAEDQFMAALYPHESGILSMPQSVCSCRANAVRIHVLTQSNAALVPVTFRLLRIYDDEKIANFVWKNDAYVYGSLQGFAR
jgi:hypothetical protein